jgi:ADP-dependent glucokinase
MGGFLKTIAIATFVALFAIIFQAYQESGKLQDLTEVLSSLVKLEKVTRKEIPRIVIGYGGCSDLRVRAVDFLDAAEIVTDKPTNKEEINTFDDFMRSFTFYFKASAAAERYTSNKELFRKLVTRAAKHPSAFKELGGNACVMGTKFLMERMEVLLAATMSDEQKGLLINGFDLVDFQPPQDFLEDIHLILEYKTGDKFGNFTATRANR